MIRDSQVQELELTICNVAFHWEMFSILITYTLEP